MHAIKGCFEKRVLDPRRAQAHYLFLVMLYSSSPRWYRYPKSYMLDLSRRYLPNPRAANF
jgi:hypothetical protein